VGQTFLTVLDAITWWTVLKVSAIRFGPFWNLQP
jgi:hypothetical protein